MTLTKKPPGTNSINAIGVIGSLVTIIAFLVPNARDWLARNGLVGWFLVAALIVIFPFVLRILSKQIHAEEGRLNKEELNEMTVKYDALSATLKRSSIQKDCKLLAETLEEWRPNSNFTTYLRHSVEFNRLPTWFSDEISSKRQLWGHESRRLEDADLRTAFDAVRDRNSQFGKLMGAKLWHAGDHSDMDFDHLAIPREYEEQKYMQILDELEDARFELADSLDELFKKVHEKNGWFKE